MSRSILVIVLIGGLIAGAAYWSYTREASMHHETASAGIVEHMSLVPVNQLTLSRVGEAALNYCPVEKKASVPMPVSKDSIMTTVKGKPIQLCCGNCEPKLPPTTEKILKGESCVDTRIQT
jgi:hypothetical protein